MTSFGQVARKSGPEVARGLASTEAILAIVSDPKAAREIFAEMKTLEAQHAAAHKARLTEIAERLAEREAAFAELKASVAEFEVKKQEVASEVSALQEQASGADAKLKAKEAALEGKKNETRRNRRKRKSRDCQRRRSKASV